MGFFKFLLSKTFFKHLAIAVVAVLILFWFIIKVLGVYTSQGESLDVPNLTGINIAYLDSIRGADQFEFIVIDSVFDDHFQKGAIVLQDPPPGSAVKHGRKIYVTVVATQPEMVFVPDLVDLSLRQALNELKASGLKLEKLEYVINFAKNAVLAQRYEGDTVRPGMEIQKGSAIELVLGKGLKGDKIKVPFLIGKTESEAINILNNSSFNVGFLNYHDERDKLHSRVFNQQPEATDKNNADFGTFVDLWFRSDLYFDFDSLLMVYAADTLGADSLIIQPMKLQD
jgi:beta-lactam-binding protein with PASTA domain